MSQYYRNELNDTLADSESFKSKIKITEKTPAAGNEKDIEVIVLLKYLSNFWKTLEMPLINREVNLMLTWSSSCVNTNSTDAGTFEIRDKKLYIPVVTLSTQDNSKLLHQLKPGFKRTTSWKKHLSKAELLRQDPNLNHFVEPSLKRVNRLFVLAFENGAQKNITLWLLSSKCGIKRLQFYD